jgi:hypothetical protein
MTFQLENKRLIIKNKSPEIRIGRNKKIN